MPTYGTSAGCAVAHNGKRQSKGKLMSAVRHNQGTTMPNMDTIKTAAIELLNDPHRKFGRGVSHTLDNVVGAALTLASEGAPLKLVWPSYQAMVMYFQFVALTVP
jgi:hypothetical protein